MHLSNSGIPGLDISELAIPGCYSITPNLSRDDRGIFVKTVHASTMIRLGLRSDFREQYYSLSQRGVVRGMHFQAPPHDHDKLVYCLAGGALDVILDLRKGSPLFGQAISISLDGSEPSGVYVARGCAHGFLSLVDGTMLLYNVTSEYSPEHDRGIRWNSIPFKWPVENPTISKRDLSFPELGEFISPFTYGE